jgi:uracil-DNA glycosylase family 4
MKDYLDPMLCEHCSKHMNDFVPPEVPDNPQIIIIGEAPSKTDHEIGIPFQGDSGNLLRPMVRVPAIYINASNIYSKTKPTTEVINIERETHLLPLLKDYPGLPVVSLGAFATQALMPKHRAGQKKESDKKNAKTKTKTKETTMAGEVRWLYDRVVWFTYHPSYYFFAGRDPGIKEFIRGYIESATSPAVSFATKLNVLPPVEEVGGSFVLDVETDGDDLPWYGTKLLLLGIRSETSETAYQFSTDWLEVPGNVFALQKWIEKQKRVIGHGLLFDILQSEVYLGSVFDKLEWFDTIVSEKNRGLDPTWGYGLKVTAHMQFRAFGWEAMFHSAIADMKSHKGVMQWLPTDFRSYNAADLHYTLKIYKNAPPSRFIRLDNDYLKYVKQMIYNGLYLDRHALAELLCEYKGKLRVAQTKGREQAGLGPDFNFNSPKQMLPVLQRLVGEDIENTKEQTLMTVLDKHPFVQTVLDVRGAEKQAEMLIEVKHRMVDKHVVHAKMTGHGAESGRTTSKEPNIQNWAKPLRRALTSRYK